VLNRVSEGQGEERIEEWVGMVGANLNDENRGKLRDAMTTSLRKKVPALHAQGVA
jgi:hypothetical protein